MHSEEQENYFGEEALSDFERQEIDTMQAQQQDIEEGRYE